jgi:hypothetical protein
MDESDKAPFYRRDNFSWPNRGPNLGKTIGKTIGLTLRS